MVHHCVLDVFEVASEEQAERERKESFSGPAIGKGHLTKENANTKGIVTNSLSFKRASGIRFLSGQAVEQSLGCLKETRSNLITA